jgi:hypothetical protein
MGRESVLDSTWSRGRSQNNLAGNGGFSAEHANALDSANELLSLTGAPSQDWAFISGSSRLRGGAQREAASRGVTALQHERARVTHLPPAWQAVFGIEKAVSQTRRPLVVL